MITDKYPITEKQITTLKLFALNYTLEQIANEQNVSVGTIKKRIKTISEKLPEPFNNALSIRNAYKRAKQGIKNPLSLDEDNLETDVYDWPDAKIKQSNSVNEKWLDKRIDRRTNDT